MSGGSTAPLGLVEWEAQCWVARFVGGEAEADELAAFQRWAARNPAHVEAFASACRQWDALGPAGLAFRADEARKASALRASAAAAPRQLARRAFIGSALAASAAAAAYVAARPPFGLWPSVAELGADYRTSVGEQREIVLASGQTVALNTRTSVALRPSAPGNARIEVIAGEAAVTVADAAHAIEVIAGRGRVLADKASFNIRCDGVSVQTACLSGRAEVVLRGRSIFLDAGQQVSYSDSGFGPVTSANATMVASWKEGVLLFHATPLANAVAEINRYRSGRIILTNAALGQRLFSARFRIANIDDAVAQIQQIFGATTTTLPGGIVLLG